MTSKIFSDNYGSEMEIETYSAGMKPYEDFIKITISDVDENAYLTLNLSKEKDRDKLNAIVQMLQSIIEEYK